MTNARHKKAVDYEAPKGVPDNRSAEEIEKDMQRVRDEMTETVNEIAAKLHPDTLKDQAKAFAKEKTDEGKTKARNLAEDAKAGDIPAIAMIATAAVAVATFVLRKIFK
ncbi:hypothetical protein J2S70_001155 [Trueperella bonasi]|uniref:DUF3618 domain-containing protein n=1 Tax=Trueperella bonasi TaxID=312286 RepID=A0ABT9NGN8_9ACTO|nr:DUF3618 domain-containing protein [Trueperella bonasi]MDP9806573.1 hypothetical protein [Trueperella bonasi]